jgi:3-oxoadipate enol-lactonase
MEMSVNGQRLYCQLEGAAEGPWLMFSYSLACDHRIWNDQVAALASDYRCLRYDTLSHGKSAASPGAYSFADLGADALPLMDAHDIDKCHFIGTSLGAMTAQGLGINQGERFLSLSICSSNAKIPEVGRQQFGEPIQAVLDHGMESVIEGNMSRWFTETCLANGGPAIDKSREMILATQTQDYAGCAAAIRDLDYLDRSGEIDLPVIVIVGVQDPGTTPAEAKKIADAIPGAVIWKSIPARITRTWKTRRRSTGRLPTSSPR